MKPIVPHVMSTSMVWMKYLNNNWTDDSEKKTRRPITHFYDTESMPTAFVFKSKHNTVLLSQFLPGVYKSTHPYVSLSLSGQILVPIASLPCKVQLHTDTQTFTAAGIETESS